MLAKWLGVVVFSFLIPACAVDSENVEQGDDEANTGTRTIQVDRVLEDGDIAGGAKISVAQVQAFLVTKKSALASYEEGGRTAATWIVEESRQEGISPLYMLVRLETESGIITSGSLENIESATGCGCPDTAACDPAHANFGAQVRCAAKLMRGYFRSLESTGTTVSGWRVGGNKATRDPCQIVPKNKATAALYTYTPWVGAYGAGCGTKKWGGTTLIAKLFNSYRSAFPAVETTSDAGIGTADASEISDASDIPDASDASTEPEASPPGPDPETGDELEASAPDPDESAFENPPVQPGKPRTGRRSTTPGQASPETTAGSVASSGCSAVHPASSTTSWLALGLAAAVIAVRRRR